MATKPSHNGPGRGTPRSRAVSRPRTTSTRTTAKARTATRTHDVLAPVGAALAAPPRIWRGIGITRRAIAFLVVAAILVLSYASSLRVYLRQEQDLATAQQQIAQRAAANADLAYEIERWKDADFVKAQARERLADEPLVAPENTEPVVRAPADPNETPRAKASSSATPKR